MRGKGKKLQKLSLVLMLALVCSGVPAQSLMAEPSEEAQADESIEENTEEESSVEVIEINTAEEFAEFAEQCYLDSWSVGKWIVLKQDIDLTGTDFQMVPVFRGTFDGEGHTISGFHNVGDGYVGGLFRYIERDGVVKQLKLKGSVEGTEDKECIGSICGINYGTIENCSFEGTINGRDTVGGIVGRNEATGYIMNCSIKGHVAGYYMTGGIAGSNHGVITYCVNYSGINDDSQWVEEDDEMDTGFLMALGGSDSDVEFFSGVDTGGIAGYSDGTISRCTNYGRVGYEHTGYNIGGIVGRQAGVVSLCSNNGRVYGRKDVGGIVGQMEPYIEVDEAQSLRNAVNKLHDLIEGTLNDLQSGKNAMKSDLDSLTAYGDAALNSGNALADQLTVFAETNTDQLREIGVRMDYVVDQLPAVAEDLVRAGEAFGEFSASLRQLTKDLAGEVSVSGNASAGAAYLAESPQLDQAVNDLQGISDQAERSAARINGLLVREDGTVRQWGELTDAQQQELTEEIMGLGNYGEVTADTSTVLGELDRLDKGDLPENVRKDLENAANHLQSMSNALKNAANGGKSIVNYMSGQPDITFSALGNEFTQSRRALDSQLRGISNSLKSLAENASKYSDLANQDLKAVNDQLNVVFNLLADNLSGFTDFSVEELYEEISVEEIDSVTSGRTDACTNSGIVKGDINIGGIVGAMSIDEEDPEDNAAGSIDYEVGRRFIMKCIISQCVNESNVTAKKDGAGGIVGYMGHGIVINSESYGKVESTEGSYVGGICGESLTVIRNCYALCDVSGGKYVGGIAGYAVTLKDCCAIVNVEASVGRKGTIAGQTAGAEAPAEDEEPQVCRNYYVDDTTYGIDDISYAGIAEPVTYQELLTVEGLPAAFRHLKVFYWVEDECLGSEEVAFGESLAGLHYPEIPAKEGSYGVWPDYSQEVMSGNLVIEGEYHDNVLVVESDEKETSNAESEFSKPYALVAQTFTEDTVLKVDMSSMAPPVEAEEKDYVMYHILLENSGIDDSEVFAVRLLNPYETAQVWGYQDGKWLLQESKPRGQYLQVDMTGTEETFCIIRTQSVTLIVVCAGAGAAVVILFAALLIRGMRKRKAKRQQTRKKSAKD